jgi:steroid 5-alpha reductase family enzyme
MFGTVSTFELTAVFSCPGTEVILAKLWKPYGGHMAPFITVVIVAAAVCLFTWIASVITHEHSWVDRIWSIVPVVYVWIFAGFSGLTDLRLLVMAILVTLWGARLTFNFARKGGYSGEEDYRWPILRARMSPGQFALFNIFFIVIYQNFILVLITLPALTAYLHQDTPFGLLDIAVAVLFLALLLGETVADQQQWRFQNAKRAEVAAGRVPAAQFVTSGLWKYSRHPNFFFEQAQWWALFLFGAIAAGSILQWTVAGALLLTLLFVGSTKFTESITKSRYPEYADYQATTSPIVPWLPRRGKSQQATA